MATFHQNYVFYIGSDGKIHCIYHRDHRSLRDSDESEHEEEDEGEDEGQQEGDEGNGSGEEEEEGDNDNNNNREDKRRRTKRRLRMAKKENLGTSESFSQQQQQQQQQWGYFNVFEVSKAPGDLPPVTYMTCHMSFASLHIFYMVRETAAIYEIWYDGKRWGHVDLLSRASAPPAAQIKPLSYNMGWYVLLSLFKLCTYLYLSFFFKRKNYVLYKGVDGHIHQLHWKNRKWHKENITALSPTLPGSYSFACFSTSNSQHVFYRGTCIYLTLLL